MSSSNGQNPHLAAPPPNCEISPGSDASKLQESEMTSAELPSPLQDHSTIHGDRPPDHSCAKLQEAPAVQRDNPPEASNIGVQESSLPKQLSGLDSSTVGLDINAVACEKGSDLSRYKLGIIFSKGINNLSEVFYFGIIDS